MISFALRRDDRYVAVMVDKKEVDKIPFTMLTERSNTFELWTAGEQSYCVVGSHDNFQEDMLNYYIERFGVLPKRKILKALTDAGKIKAFLPSRFSLITVYDSMYLRPYFTQLELYHAPRCIYIYGRNSQDASTLFVSGWCDIFTKTIKKGRLVFYMPPFGERTLEKEEALYIGLSKTYREILFGSLDSRLFDDVLTRWLRALFSAHHAVTT